MDLFDILLITLSALAILAFAVGILSFARTSDQRQQQPPHLPQPVQPVQNALQQGHELARVVQHGAANAQGVGLALRRRRPGVEGAEAAVALGGDVAGEEAEGDAAGPGACASPCLFYHMTVSELQQTQLRCRWPTRLTFLGLCFATS